MAYIIPASGNSLGSLPFALGDFEALRVLDENALV
jgi:hypothetical protein